MSHLRVSSVSGCSSFNFLRQNPSLMDALLTDCNYDHTQVMEIVNYALQASRRCQVASSYIQAVITGQTTFLITNLNKQREDRLMEAGSTWLIGRDSTCAITASHMSVSRCHAVIGYHPIDGFYIADVGSSNGTWLNRRRLAPRYRRTLKDGDLLEFAQQQAEFFLVSRKQHQPALYEPTYI